jgi:hypothetical protein
MMARLIVFGPGSIIVLDAISKSHRPRSAELTAEWGQGGIFHYCILKVLRKMKIPCHQTIG